MAVAGTSCGECGKQPSCWKYLSNAAKPSRVAPVLLASHSISFGRSVQCSINSSSAHSCFISGASFPGNERTTASGRENDHDRISQNTQRAKCFGDLTSIPPLL